MVDHRWLPELTPFPSHPYGLPPLRFDPAQKYGTNGFAHNAAAILAYHRRKRLYRPLASSHPYPPMIAGYLARGFPLSTWASRIPSPEMPTRRGQYLSNYGGFCSPYQAPTSDLLNPGRQNIPGFLDVPNQSQYSSEGPDSASQVQPGQPAAGNLGDQGTRTSSNSSDALSAQFALGLRLQEKPASSNDHEETQGFPSTSPASSIKSMHGEAPPADGVESVLAETDAEHQFEILLRIQDPADVALIESCRPSIEDCDSFRPDCPLKHKNGYLLFRSIFHRKYKTKCFKKSRSWICLSSITKGMWHQLSKENRNHWKKRAHELHRNERV
ncbi:hypothetical protein PM082_022264 [Marasmius tenuissimus]|nr:hypothetical protein PM082_022264 [Marasmius tenuissimus]